MKKTETMQMQIKTTLLQEMVAKAVKGASFNKLIPLTSMMAIKLQDGYLKLQTTDMTNYLYIIENDFDGYFDAVIMADQFSKLVAKMTSKNIVLTVTDNALEVVGNGTYKIELPMDEGGKPIKYPDPVAALPKFAEEATIINLATIKSVLYSVKPAVSTELEIPCYTGYYADENQIIGTDTCRIACLAEKMTDRAVLFNPEMMNLLDLMTDEKVYLNIDKDVFLFRSENCMVYGRALSGIADFDVEAINGLVNTEFPVKCRLAKSELLRVLDRISLFVGTYDEGRIELDFMQDWLRVRSKNVSGVEDIQYVEVTDHVPFNCNIEITALTTQVKAVMGDVVTICYDPDNTSALKILEGNLTQIVALLD